jgi:trehalose 6-phosphate synthase/phosphatase
MAKTIIVSNRLPVRIERNEETKELEYQTSAGGLATGLGSVYKEGNNVWIGWPGLVVSKKQEKEEITAGLEKENMRPVFLTENDIKDYYEGFSNETLWPTFHYFSQYTEYDVHLWEAYKRANQKFADEVMNIAEPGDTLWVHDYQLMLVPGIIRTKIPNTNIGYFLHIPFPSYEVFRMLPYRKQLLTGLLGSDLVGFHTYDDMRHFLSSVNRIVGLSNHQGRIMVDNRAVMVDSFPMGIDYEKYASTAASPEAIEKEVQYRKSLGNQKLILSVDRLDYSKGIPQRLKAFQMLFEKYPEYIDQVSLLLIVVPSRDKVPKYQELKQEVDELVGRINGKYGKINWSPIYFFYRSFPLPELSAFYRMADVALVTPMRDGMNLVCKEYVASRLNKKGVLILSEMCGASKELSDSILINPNDADQMIDAIVRALNMPEDEQIRHNTVMQESLKRYNVHKWVQLFMNGLHLIKEEQRGMETKRLDEQALNKMVSAYKKSNSPIIFLDYDGTLVGFNPNPEMAKPDKELDEIITSLSSLDNSRIVVISGRKKSTLAEWMAPYPIDMIAEHGVWLKEQGKDWELVRSAREEWKSEIRPVLEMYVNRTPGSFIEEKDYSLAWHFRKVETGLGDLRKSELSSHLKYLANNSELQVLEGDMVVEIKSIEINKGRASKGWLERFGHDFIMAIGDDATDEDTFRAMPQSAFTIKVGSVTSAAKYNVDTFVDVRNILKRMISDPEKK